MLCASVINAEMTLLVICTYAYLVKNWKWNSAFITIAWGTNVLLTAMCNYIS